MAFVKAMRANKALEALLAEAASFNFNEDDYERPPELEKDTDAVRLKNEPLKRFEPLLDQIVKELVCITYHNRRI